MGLAAGLGAVAAECGCGLLGGAGDLHGRVRRVGGGAVRRAVAVRDRQTRGHESEGDIIYKNYSSLARTDPEIANVILKFVSVNSFIKNLTRKS